MKALDLVTMKRLDSKVNIIPVIAKADTITKTELQKFKSKVSFQHENPNSLTAHSDPGGAISQMCVCLCVWTRTFALNDLTRDVNTRVL